MALRCFQKNEILNCDGYIGKIGRFSNRPYKLLAVDDMSSSLENKHSNDPALIYKTTKP